MAVEIEMEIRASRPAISFQFPLCVFVWFKRPSVHFSFPSLGFFGLCWRVLGSVVCWPRFNVGLVFLLGLFFVCVLIFVGHVFLLGPGFVGHPFLFEMC